MIGREFNEGIVEKIGASKCQEKLGDGAVPGAGSNREAQRGKDGEVNITWRQRRQERSPWE